MGPRNTRLVDFTRVDGALAPHLAHTEGVLRPLFGVTQAEKHKDEHYADYPLGPSALAIVKSLATRIAMRACSGCIPKTTAVVQQVMYIRRELGVAMMRGQAGRFWRTWTRHHTRPSRLRAANARRALASQRRS